MGGRNKKRLSIGAVVIVILAIIVWQLSKGMTSAEPLTEAEATSKVQELYEGEIVEVSKEPNSYRITITLDTGTYDVEIDRETGNIGSLIRTKQELVSKDGEGPTDQTPAQPEEQTPQDSPEPPPTEPEKQAPQEPKEREPQKPASETPKELAKQITETEAAAIALKAINGEVDDIEIGQSGGITYYLVEIENENEENEEGMVQINAISGKVMSITLDD